MNNVENNKFSWQNGEYSILDSNGMDTKNYGSNYFNEKKIRNITFSKLLNVGDIVKTKGTGRLIEIKYIDFKLNDSVCADYAGTVYNSGNNNLILLGQEDIESRVFDVTESIKTK